MHEREVRKGGKRDVKRGREARISKEPNRSPPESAHVVRFLSAAQNASSAVPAVVSPTAGMVLMSLTVYEKNGYCLRDA